MLCTGLWGVEARYDYEAGKRVMHRLQWVRARLRQCEKGTVLFLVFCVDCPLLRMNVSVTIKAYSKVVNAMLEYLQGSFLVISSQKFLY